MSDEVALWLSFMGGVGVGLIIVGLTLLWYFNQWKRENHK